MDEVVKKEFEVFLTSQLPQQTLDVLDDIVLHYLTNVLEMLDQDDSFNIDDFILMMDAYIPGFGDIPSDCVFSWMVGLADKLRITRERVTENSICNNKSEAIDDLRSLPASESTSSKKTDRLGEFSSFHKPVTEACSTSGNDMTVTVGDSKRHISPYVIQEQDEMISEGFNSTVQTLCELFPSACLLEVRRCLTIANGDADEAARLMLISRDSDFEGTGQQYLLADSNPKPHQVSGTWQNLHERDQEKIKSKQISRYGFVEVTDDQRVHRPSPPKQEEKKLVRYRDNQVVSTKGERFLLEKRRETDEEKKTYINLKPARKYRFH